MNKELIKKYKPEFDHWLNGGKLLIKMSTGWEPVPLEYAWHLTSKLIVIDDSYSYYRKALAEGKTIQYRNTSVNGFENWEDLNGLSFNPNFEHRIKPEEPQFKVGDWVRIVNCNLVKNQKEVFCIDFIDDKNNCFGFNSDTEYCNMNYLELWKPKPNEWVIPESNINDYAFITIKYNSVALMSERCQPFIGELPTRLKD